MATSFESANVEAYWNVENLISGAPLPSRTLTGCIVFGSFTWRRACRQKKVPAPTFAKTATIGTRYSEFSYAKKPKGFLGCAFAYFFSRVLKTMGL